MDMKIAELIRQNRSYRRFDNSVEIEQNTLIELVELARLSSSARNAQPLKYMLINERNECDFIFPLLSWAGYLSNWDGPAKTEQPTAYIIVLKDNRISQNALCDAGLAIQNILLGACEKGLGGCIIGAVKKEELRTEFDINEDLDILYVLALGKPSESIQIEEMKNGDIKYWRDDNDQHHVPKRKIDEIIIPHKA